MRKVIMPAIFLVILVLGSNQLVASAQENEPIITLNPGATNSDSQNPISPANITVPVGTNVTWINKDSSPHFIVSGTPEEGPNNIFYGDYFATDENYTVPMDSPGLYSYYDPTWSHIKGQITVEDVYVPTELGSSENSSDLNSFDNSFVQDTDTTNVVESNESDIQEPEDGSFASSLPSSSSLSNGGSNQSSFPSSSSLSSSSSPDQALMGIFDKVGPLLGLFMNGSSSSPLSSLSQSNESFDVGDFDNQSSFPSSSSLSSSSSPDQALMGIFDKVGPLLGLFMNGSSSSPLSSLSQSPGMFEDNLIDNTTFSNTEFEDSQLSDINASSPLDNLFALQNKSVTPSEEEKIKVQEELVNSLRKAFSVGAEIPEFSTYSDDNATIFIKVDVINPIDKIANASDFPILINYEYDDGSVGSAYTYANDAGRIEPVRPSTYAILAAASETSDESKDSFLNSYSTSYSKGCSGHISYTETKDCTITKKYTNTTN
jgi:plastocyanin